MGNIPGTQRAAAYSLDRQACAECFSGSCLVSPREEDRDSLHGAQEDDWSAAAGNEELQPHAQPPKWTQEPPGSHNIERQPEVLSHQPVSANVRQQALTQQPVSVINAQPEPVTGITGLAQEPVFSEATIAADVALPITAQGTVSTNEEIGFTHAQQPVEAPVIQNRESALTSSQAVDVNSLVASQFPFLSDHRTIDFITKTKIMFVMRGLSGSGKSTVVELLTKTYPGAVICSADHYFMQGGVYKFDLSLLSAAHQQSQSAAANACQSGINTVIIDNTNVQRWEMKPYLDQASFHGYLVVIVTPKTPWRLDPEELARRNSHGVPFHVISKKVRAFTSLAPLYWGWFVCLQDSDRLCNLGHQCFTQCLQLLPEFSTDLKSSLGEQDDSALMWLYGRGRASSSLLHCTAFFAGSGGHRKPDVSAYMEKPAVAESLGHAFVLYVIGFVVTPRTFGARVILTKRQLTLWGQEDSTYNSGARNDDLGTSHIDSVENVTLQLSDIAISCDTDGEIEETLRNRPRFQPTFGNGSRAHISLGWTQGSQAVETGFDLLEIIECEDRRANDPSMTQLNDGAARYYGDGQCAVYLDKPVKVGCLFSEQY